MKIVDVEPIIKELYKIGNEKDELGEHEFALGIDTVIYLLEQAETVEAEPVKRGKWEVKQQTKMFNDYMTISGKYPTCNLCGFAEMGPFNETNYCPNCGAKMDLEE